VTPDDEKARIKERERGAEAERILASPVWQEAYEKLARRINERMLHPDTPDDEVIARRRELLTLYDVKRYIEGVMATGRMAQQQLETLNERAAHSTSA
jgi:hypothetical protein